jgi:AraC-like DNA-binding protein
LADRIVIQDPLALNIENRAVRAFRRMSLPSRAPDHDTTPCSGHASERRLRRPLPTRSFLRHLAGAAQSFAASGKAGSMVANVVAHEMDSELGRWTTADWKPASDHPLAWAVERIWDFHGLPAHRRERVFPNGIVELIIQLDDRYRDVDGDATKPTPATCVTGLFSAPFVIEAPARPCRVLGIRFHPPGAWALLAHPLLELAGITTDLGDLLGGAAPELAERCADGKSGAERVGCVIAWLSERLQREQATQRVDPAVRWATACIAQTAGAVPISAIRARTGLSTARLSATFREQVGVTPKRLARIRRFGKALGMLHDSPQPLSRIALTAGYYDQPHMNAEFRELAGLTPREFLAGIHYPNTTSLAES